MEKIRRKESLKTPFINCDLELGSLDIYGRSIPEHSLKFYEDIFKELDQYILNPQKRTIVNIFLEYVNSSSSKCILSIIKKLELLKIEGTSEIILTWFYDEEDEGMRSEGELYESIVSFEFNYAEINI